MTPPTDELLLRLESYGYGFVCHLPATGELAGIMAFLFTYGLCVGLDDTGYRTRYCYPTFGDAILALIEWDGHGDPPGPWIKQKGGVERSNPNIGGIPVKVEA